MTGPGDKRRALLVAATLAIVLFTALFLRVRDLDRLGLWIDEDLTWLTTRGILEEGVPRHPSGRLYLRDPLYHYLVAGVAAVAGTSERALRFPSAVASVALLLLVFLLGKALGGRGVGLLATAIVAFSGWDVHCARMARMYSPLLLFFTLAVYLVVLGLGHDRRARLARWFALPVTSMAVLSHQLGTTLGIVYLVPFLFPRERRPPTRWLLAGVLAAGLPFAAMRVVTRLVNQGEVVPAYVDRLPTSVTLPLFGPLELKNGRVLLLDVWRDSPSLAVLGVVSVVLLGGWLIRWLLQHGARSWPLAVAGAFVLAVMANQLVLAAVLGALLIKLAAADVPMALRLIARLATVMALGILALMGALWLSGGWENTAHREAIRSLQAIPQPWWRVLLWHYPMMGGIVLCGLVATLLESLRKEADQRIFLVGGAFLGPLVFMGLRPSPSLRVHYTVYLHALLAVLFALTVLRVARTLAASLTDPRVASRTWRTPPHGAPELPLRPSTRLLGGAIAAGLALLPGGLMDLRDAWGVSHREYGWNADRIRDPSLHFPFYYDSKTPGLHVSERRGPEDIVIGRDAVNLYPYLGPCDYLIRSRAYVGMAVTRDGTLVDKTLGIPVLSTAAALEEVLREHANRRIWIVSSKPEPGGPILNIPDDLLSLLDRLEPFRVYTARDDISYVLSLPPGALAAAASDP